MDRGRKRGDGMVLYSLFALLGVEGRGGRQHVTGCCQRVFACQKSTGIASTT